MFQNSISDLKKVSVKPVSWIIKRCAAKPGFVLYFSYKKNDMPCQITTARGETKVYRSIDTAIKDVYQIDQTADVLVISRDYLTVSAASAAAVA